MCLFPKAEIFSNYFLIFWGISPAGQKYGFIITLAGVPDLDFRIKKSII
jgi:hypothetical protein